MGAVLTLDQMLADRHVWRGQPTRAPLSAGHATGVAALDAVLPQGGWPPAALTEILIPGDGVGELQMLWPTLARITQASGLIALVTPPYIPFAPTWAAAGIALRMLHIIQADAREASWATEQCLRSGACAAVLCWPHHGEDRALRRLQVAAETGQALGFAFRLHSAAANPSPAALRIVMDAHPRQLRVIKCRGALTPPRPIPFARSAH